MNVRRRTLLASPLLLTAPAACSSSGAGSEVSGRIGYSYWGNPARGELVQQISELFTLEHPDLSVAGDLADYTAYVERMTVRAAGGGLSCVVGVQSTFAAIYAENDVFRPLDDLIDEGVIDVSGISPAALEAGRYAGRQYVIPTGTFVRPLAYNEELVTASGQPPPTDDMTWDGYGDWLRTVQDGLPAGVNAGELEGGLLFTLNSWVIGHGEQMYDDGRLAFDRDLLADWFQFWLDLTRDGATMPPSAIPELNGALELTPLARRRVACGTRDIPHIAVTETALAGAGHPTRIVAVDAPCEAGVETANVIGINGMAIAANCGQPREAAEFIDFFTNDVEANRIFGSNNGIVTSRVPREALLADPSTSDAVRRSLQEFSDLEARDQLVATSYPAGLVSLTSSLQRVYQTLAFGRSTVSEAVDEFFTEADIVLS